MEQNPANQEHLQQEGTASVRSQEADASQEKTQDAEEAALAKEPQDMEQEEEKRGWFASLRKEFLANHGALILTMAILIIGVFFLFYRFESAWKVLQVANRILRPVFWGLGLAYLLNPIMMFFRRLFFRLFNKRSNNRLRVKRTAKILSIVAAMLVFALIVAALVLMIVPQTISSLKNFLEGASDQFEQFQAFIARRLESGNGVEQYFWKLLNKGILDLQDFMQNHFMSWVKQYLSTIVSAVSSGVSYLIWAIVAVVIAVYVLKDKEIFQGQSKKFLYAVCRPEKANSILDTARHAHKIFGGFIIGKIIDSLIIGMIALIALAIMRMPYVWLLAAIIGVTNVIPFFGPFIGAIPCAILVLLTDPIKVIPFIIFVFLLQQMDGNIIGPVIIGDVTGLSEFWITVSLLLFGGLLGLFGMLIAVPLFAVLYYLFKNFLEARLAKKELPVASVDFKTVDTYDTQTGTFTYFQENDYTEGAEVAQRFHRIMENRKRRSKHKKWKRKHKREEIDEQEEIK